MLQPEDLSPAFRAKARAHLARDLHFPHYPQQLGKHATQVKQSHPDGCAGSDSKLPVSWEPGLAGGTPTSHIGQMNFLSASNP